MADIYSADGAIAAVAVAPGTTALAIFASAFTRARVHFVDFSVGGVPVGDNLLNWLVRRLTTVGTNTPVTPAPFDLAAPAAQLSAAENFTAEPTFTTQLLQRPTHQRAGYQWNLGTAKEILIPAIANAGLGITPSHASYNGSAQANAEWLE